jgi:hypothetical protein
LSIINIFWVWFYIDPIHSSVFRIQISQNRKMIVISPKFIGLLLEKCEKYTVYTDESGTWYSEVCTIIGLKHHLHLHSRLEKSLINGMS